MADEEPADEDVTAMADHPLAVVWRAGGDAATSPDFRDADGELNEAAYVRYALNVMRRVHARVVAAAESRGRTAGYAEAVQWLRDLPDQTVALAIRDVSYGGVQVNAFHARHLARAAFDAILFHLEAVAPSATTEEPATVAESDAQDRVSGSMCPAAEEPNRG